MVPSVPEALISTFEVESMEILSILPCTSSLKLLFALITRISLIPASAGTTTCPAAASRINTLFFAFSVQVSEAICLIVIFSKFPLYDIVKKLPLYGLVEVDEEARYIEAKFDYNGKVYTIASIYVPNGGPTAKDIRNSVKDLTSTEVFTKKMKFNDRLQKRFQESINNNEICFFPICF